MIRVLIADDEAPARRKLRELLAREEDFEIVGEAADGVEAVETIRSSEPDVVFLDIQMPKLDGFGVVSEVGVEAMPLVVFVTAYDEHALRAFEVHALDYLLKPFAPSRFKKLLDRVRRQLNSTSSGDLSQRIERLLAAVRPASGYLRQILAERDEDRQVLLAVDEIDVLRSDGNYLRFLTSHGEYRRRGTLRDLETGSIPLASSASTVLKSCGSTPSARSSPGSTATRAWSCATAPCSPGAGGTGRRPKGCSDPACRQEKVSLTAGSTIVLKR